MIGYLLIFLGLGALGASYETIKTALGVQLPAPFTKATLLPVAALLIILGAFIALRVGANKKVTEVPIYHGKEIVGYRRMAK